MTNTKREEAKPDPRCGEYHPRGVTLDGVVEWNGKVLLMQRAENPHKGKWALPGGWLEKDEDATEGTATEVWEETGVRVKNPRLIGAFTDPARHPKQAISLAYAFDVDGDPTPDATLIGTKEVLGIRWVPMAEARRMALAFDHNKILDAHVKRRR